MNQAAGLPPYRNMITYLIDDGWSAVADPRADRFGAATRTHLTCPADYLRVTIDMSPDAVVHCRLGIAPGGTGEPARWRASASAPPAFFWLACARSAQHSVLAPQRANLFPGDVLTRIGWRQLRTQATASSPRSIYICPHGTSRVSYQPSQRAMPTLWSITRQGAGIGVLVSAAEPRALPTLILALALSPTHGDGGCCSATPAMAALE